EIEPDLEPAAVEPVRLEDNENDDDEAVDGALEPGGTADGRERIRERARIADAEGASQFADATRQVVFEVAQERIDHHHEDRAEHGAVQAADAANEDDDDELEREQQREHFRADEGHFVRIEAAREPGHGGADGERHHLVDREIDADALRRGLAVADGDEGAAGRRAQKVERQHEHQDEETESEVVEAVAVAADGETEQLYLLDPHAVVSVGHALPARGNLLDDETERDCGDDQIDAGNAQRRKTDERADGAGEPHRKRQVDEKRHAVPLHVAGGIGADGKEGGVTERYLPGEAGEDQEPD